jgi:UDP-N-acetylglucosamine:LPS N-acetylglucosamine transferase
MIVDLLGQYPFGLGRLLRGGYAAMLHGAPWLYELIFRIFFVVRRHRGAEVSPVVSLVAPSLRRLVDATSPDAVVSTFHLAGLVAGRLRRQGRLSAPSMVLVTDPAAHHLWRDRSTDLYLCAYPGQAGELSHDLGVPSMSIRPVVRPQFRSPSVGLGFTDWLPDGEDRKVVMVSTGSWGIGRPARVAAALYSTGRYLPVVLCGHNRDLETRLRARQDCIALGWVESPEHIMATASALVENSGGGLTCWEAFAAGLPVVTFKPIPGHGRAGARCLARAGLTLLATDDEELVAALDDVTAGSSSTRERLRSAEGALFGAGRVEADAAISARLLARPGTHGVAS